MQQPHPGHLSQLVITCWGGEALLSRISHSKPHEGHAALAVLAEPPRRSRRPNPARAPNPTPSKNLVTGDGAWSGQSNSQISAPSTPRRMPAKTWRLRTLWFRRANAFCSTIREASSGETRSKGIAFEGLVLTAFGLALLVSHPNCFLKDCVPGGTK